MKSLIIRNATVVTPHEVIPNGSICIEHGIITEVGTVGDREGLPELDVAGSLVLPGIIDIHTDAYDMEINPRPGANIPLEVAFRELERKMSGCGFTTVFHSLHLGYNVAELHSRSKHTRQQVFETVHRLSQGQTLLKNKIHLRFEVTGVNAYELCMDLIDKGYVSLLSVMDHTPGQGQISNEYFFKVLKGQGLTDELARIKLQEMVALPRIEGERLVRLIDLARSRHIPVASHDDDSVEKVNVAHQLGIDICEFPINEMTARHATTLGMHVIGGASNVLRGGSLSNNLDIRNAIALHIVDSLCSDYYPAAILHSIWKLVHEDGMPWNTAANLASLNPAKAVRIDRTTGSLEAGKHADLIIVKKIQHIPMVTHTIVDGNIVSQAAVKALRHKEEEVIWQ